ncbi:unnamed protein product [Prunus armeniaca]|uniref:Uncharacterized protein n=1 Tax=Prunus armeniaca TaxID=36596 RepID=A0A6J5Y1N2_PRUAR|nr:unnamed protein product [Prunus armeniaca]
MASSHSVMGDVCKARERIHRRMVDRRLLSIPVSCRRVAVRGGATFRPEVALAPPMFSKFSPIKAIKY